MRNTLKHLTLLTRMKDDGLLPTLTGSFSEDAIAQACGQVETLQLQERLHIRKTKRIQEELVRVPDFAALYGALCRQEIGDEEIASVLESADGYGERLTAYPQEQVLAVMKLELLPSLRFEYLKYYFPFVMYEEEEQVILDIVLADEPTGNLDSRTSADVLGLLQRTSREFNQTLVMITHNDAIAQLADRIVRIEDGKIVG